MNKKTPIIVTGGAGFIGSHTVVALQEAGFQAIIVDNLVNSNQQLIQGIEELVAGPVIFYQIDCNDKFALRDVFDRHKPEAVIHFAAYKAVGESVAEPLKYYHNNLESLRVLLELMREFEVFSLVFSSSCTVYGQADVLPVTEDSPIKPAESPYGFTKQVGEQMIRDFAKSWPSFKAVLLRYFNPIGAHPSALIGELPNGVPNNLVPFITQTAAGLRKELVVFGNDYPTPDGTCIRDYIHVMDLAEAHVASVLYLQAQNVGKVDHFNAGTGQGHSVLELIKAFERVNQLKLNYSIGQRRSGDVTQVWADVNKINTILKWHANRSLDQALKDAWHWQQRLGL